MSDLSYILVLKFEDVHMDIKANEYKSKNHLNNSFELMVWVWVQVLSLSHSYTLTITHTL